MNRVTANKLRDLQRREIVRRRRAPLSLDQVAGDDGQPLADRVTDLGPLPEVLVERGELKARVHATYHQLSADDLAVAKGYADGLTPTEMSRRFGLSRMAVYRARERIRKVFAAAGLGEFLT